MRGLPIDLLSIDTLPLITLPLIYSSTDLLFFVPFVTYVPFVVTCVSLIDKGPEPELET